MLSWLLLMGMCLSTLKTKRTRNKTFKAYVIRLHLYFRSEAKELG